jgi:ubiquinone/menaquinone biosynthesis C-methylase UbiE
MSENRYSGDLVKYHHQIYACIPHAREMHIEAAKAINESAWRRQDLKLQIAEIGCGEGETTREILKLCPGVEITATDISSEMIERARKKLRKYVMNGDLHLYDFDAFDVLPMVKKNLCDVFTSTWTLHNFEVGERNGLLREAHRILRPGGLLVIMDKMYDENLNLNRMFREQVKFYDKLPDQIKDAIRNHERGDFSPEVRINRGEFIATLKDIGFSEVWTRKRIINDEVVCARKQYD